MRILLIENDEKLSNFIRYGLEQEEYSVNTASCGESGLLLAANSIYDSIIIDAAVPGINGLELCKMIRVKYGRVPFVILGTGDSAEEKVRGFEAGADDCIAMPFSFEDISDRLRSNIRKRNGARSAVQTYGLVLNDAEQSVKRDGNDIRLTKNEFRLLQFLVNNAEKVVSREMIAGNLWGNARAHETNIIDVYINFLRKKIDRNYDNKLIHTVRGRGYILKFSAKIGFGRIK
ncbi:MAG: response regulator transcription factor [Elusimicrobiota bacterium]